LSINFHVLTLFPEMFEGPVSQSILSRAVKNDLIDIELYDIRDLTHDKRGTVDDYPFGGGPGMILKAEPIFETVESLYASDESLLQAPVILLSPQGTLLTQPMAEDLSLENNVILICGHYEGVDERIRKHLVTDEISIGDYVLTGGELPAMVLIDSVTRLIPGVLGSAESTRNDSFTSRILQYPQYTRPSNFRGWEVPEILLSGNHSAIKQWRRQNAIARTAARRPDLLE